MGAFDFDDTRPPVRPSTTATRLPPSNSLGIAALVIGGVSLIIGIIPILGAVAVITGIVGAFLALIAIAIALTRGGHGVGFGIGGLVLCLAGSAIAAWHTWIVVGPQIERAAERSRQLKQEQHP